MKTCLALVAMAWMVQAAPVLAQDAAAPPQPARTHATWIRGPDTQELIWPGYAFMAHMNGHVELDCVIDAKGKLKPCAVTAEAPKDQGFAKAAIDDLETTKMRPPTVDGTPVPDPHVQITYEFIGADGHIRYMWRSQ